MIDLTTMQLFEALPEFAKLSGDNKKLKTLNTILAIGALSLLVLSAIHIYNEHLNSIQDENRTN
jgi:hypothetical protein